MTCPHCNQPLSAFQIRRLWAQFTASLRKVHAGGRPKKITPIAPVQETPPAA